MGRQTETGMKCKFSLISRFSRIMMFENAFAVPRIKRIPSVSNNAPHDTWLTKHFKCSCADNSIFSELNFVITWKLLAEQTLNSPWDWLNPSLASKRINVLVRLRTKWGILRQASSWIIIGSYASVVTLKPKTVFLLIFISLLCGQQ